jgi:hypothetical protein
MLAKSRVQFPEIVIGMLFTIAIFAMGMLFASSGSQPPQSQPHVSNENTVHPPDGGLWNWLFHDAAGFFTLWLVIVGGAQVGMFYWQLRYMKQSNA